MSRATKTQLVEQLEDARKAIVQLNEQYAVLKAERDAMLVAQRPSRRNATPEQAKAHNTYREALSAARELAITTGKSVLVTSRG